MSKIDQTKIVKDFAYECRKNILEMALVAGANSSHFGGALSIAVSYTHLTLPTIYSV